MDELALEREKHDFDISIETMEYSVNNRESPETDEITNELLKYGRRQLESEMTIVLQSIAKQ